MPPEIADTFMKVAESMQGSGAVVVGFLFALFVGAVFATLGGLIGGAVFRSATPPPPPQYSAPPPPPPPMPSI
jgi:hypothetical protein